MSERHLFAGRRTPAGRGRLAVGLTAASVAATIGGMVLGTAPISAAAPTAPPAPANRPSKQDASFQAICSFSHRNNDDPIVFLDEPGKSHTHDFYGNSTTDAFSSIRSLRRTSQTTCNIPFDKSAYWVANLRRNGRPLTADRLVATYQARFKKRVEPFPPGLQMVSGNANAMAEQSLSTVEWTCNDDLSHASASVIPSCPNPNKPLTLTVWFPDCWNGRDLDSADHTSHMAFSSRGRCPASHPVGVPGLKETVFWPEVTSSKGLTLSAMNSTLTGHADFMNGWDQFGHGVFVRTFLDLFNSDNLIGSVLNRPLRDVIGVTAGPANRPEPTEDDRRPMPNMPGMAGMPAAPQQPAKPRSALDSLWASLFGDR
ncbi:DUF1996 domain-containing protein [Actinocrispum wychmicini]|uniref:Uncharacterized protein DUF1996 n=1 Tax=Actinocrispum wychmicini TaxID=1213861 RepID=A0A4R2JTM6_9PSEU|nr:DUF1996 domain-containing protein [Actinocrispum wychmicini]TCO60626.1 uncharacterized protein DUF1996 [Actinocrispum wychmicini]